MAQTLTKLLVSGRQFTMTDIDNKRQDQRTEGEIHADNTSMLIHLLIDAEVVPNYKPRTGLWKDEWQWLFPYIDHFTTYTAARAAIGDLYDDNASQNLIAKVKSWRKGMYI